MVLLRRGFLQGWLGEGLGGLFGRVGAEGFAGEALGHSGGSWISVKATPFPRQTKCKDPSRYFRTSTRLLAGGKGDWRTICKNRLL